MTAANIKAKFYTETCQFLLYWMFLVLILCTFAAYERLLVEGTGVGYIRYGYCVIEALILAKMLVFAEAFNIGNRFSDKSLIYPVLYKTIVFSVLVFVFNFIEHFVFGVIKGKAVTTIYDSLTIRSWNIFFAKALIMFFVFILFFSFLELSRVLGENKVFNLFFRRNR